MDLRKDTQTFLGKTITLDEAFVQFQYHPSKKQIRETLNNNESFSFMEVTLDQVRRLILHLDGYMATAVGDISVDIMKLGVDLHLSTIKL